jgi:hypothetical protein
MLGEKGESMDADELIQSRKDIKLIGRAVRERWPIKPEFRAQIIAKLMTVVMASDASDRDVVAATRVLASIDKMNMDLEKAMDSLTIDDLKDELKSRLMDLAQAQEALNDARDTGRIEE